jgi:hypothetical protein
MKNLIAWLANLPDRSRTIFKTCVFGVVAGLVAVAFQLAMNGCFRAYSLQAHPDRSSGG